MASSGPGREMKGLHRFAVATAAATLLLIAAGGLVTSTESGLSVPDWPTTYGQNPFTFPISKWVGGIRFEHSHRLIASAVGLLTVFLAVWLQRREDRLWVRRLGWAALAAVVAQGVLGGLTVLFLLPAPVSVAHACLAQTFFCLVVTLAIVTSPRFRAAEAAAPSALSRAAAWTTGLVFLQLLAGAVVRHTRAGLAIPDFPLALGRVIPPIESFAVLIHFAHRAGAALVSIGAAVCVVQASRAFRSTRPGLVRAAWLLAGLVAAQATLGALTVLSKKDVVLTTAHVATGALVLGVSLGLAIASRRSVPGAVGAALAAAQPGRAGTSPAPTRTATEALSWK
ncbi:MAG TPA: COX15/CtaA family protein [Thermoanaerobaculia bacterium]|nr:COX15/CtaA family protein [Thermoanaerobaculia bacterium]